jgi:hypothetical protein
VSPEEYEEVSKLRAKVRELEADLENALIDMHNAEKNQEAAEDDLITFRSAVLEAIEMTRRSGPAAGMERVVEWLETPGHSELPLPNTNYPYDWLTRWKVEAA